MKKVISISLGSSARNAAVTAHIGGKDFEISRIGTDGDTEKMRRLFREYDGTADAFGIGGFDLKIYAGRDRTIPFPKPNEIIRGLRTPVYDGSNLKVTLEPMVIRRHHRQGTLELDGKSAFCIIGADRFGMAEALDEHCGSVTYGDLPAAVGLPLPIRRFSTLVRMSKLLGPLVVRLPFSWLYPTGPDAERRDSRLEKYFTSHDIIAGDFHYIAKYRPDSLEGRTVITNTTTQENIALLKASGARAVITTTPQLDGRTFGTNVMEAVLAVLIGKDDPAADDFTRVIDRLELDRGQHFDFETNDA